MSGDANSDTAQSEERRTRPAQTAVECAQSSTSTLLQGLSLAGSDNDAFAVLMRVAHMAVSAPTLLILEEIGTDLRLRAGYPNDISSSPTAFPPLTDATRRPMIHARKEVEAIGAPLATGMSGMISAPLDMGSGRRGAILAFRQTDDEFDQADLDILDQLAQITAYRLDALAARGENRLMAQAVDGSASGFAIADATLPDKPLTYVNRAFERMTGYSAQEVLGTNCRFLSSEPMGSPERTRLRNTVAQNGSGRFVLRNHRKTGEAFWNELTLYPILDDTGQARYLVATQTDVSQRIEAQRANERIQRRIDDALAHSRDGFLMLAPNGEVIQANSTTLELFPSPNLGWASGTKFEDNWIDYLSGVPDSIRPKDAAFLTPDLEALCRASDGTEAHLPDGRTVLIRAQYTTERTIVLGATDVTALKSVERMLRQRVAAIESAPDGIAVADRDNRILYANSSLANLLSVASERHLIGRRWASHYKSDEAKAALEHVRDAIASNEKIDVRLPFSTKDGDERVHDVSVSRSEGVGVILVVRDITEQLAARRRRAELDEQLSQARRQQSIAELSAGLAHDFNNLLSAINGSAVLISTDDDVSPGIRRFAERIVSAGTQAARLVNRLLDMGRVEEEDSVFDLRAATKDGLSLAKTNLSASTKLSITMGDDVLEVHGSPTEAGQIVINLVLNSHHALSGAAGRVDVSLEKFEGHTAEDVVVGRILPDVTYARLSVSDNGSGIPPDIINKIFEPYFSTKGEKGTGIGLASITAIVRRVNGAIAVHSVLGEGTRFDIFWPIDQPNAVADNTETPEDQVDLSDRLIMIVDDELEVAEVLGSFLERMGAEVAVVDDPELAIEAIQDDPTVWTAVISDYSMGKINGGDLVEQVRELTPDLPIFILTALARTISDTRINDRTVQSVFAKPANFRQISQALANIPASKTWDE